MASDRPEIIVYGGSGHGRTLAALLSRLDRYDVVGYADDGRSDDQDGLPYLGGASSLPEIRRNGTSLAANGVGGIGDVASRVAVAERLEADGFSCPALVDPSAIIETTAHIDAGAQILAFAYVGTDVAIGSGSLVNTGAVISHDCNLGRFVNCSPGALLAGGVALGDRASVGMGATVNIGVQVGHDARIGNGAVVIADVPANGVVRAGERWSRQNAGQR